MFLQLTEHIDMRNIFDIFDKFNLCLSIINGTNLHNTFILNKNLEENARNNL